MNDAATTLIDNLIARVEEQGFDATAYTGNEYNGMKRCYIGNARQLVGLSSQPPEMYSSVGLDPKPELVLALTAMDVAAAPKLRPLLRYLPKSLIREEPGRIAEAYGLSLIRSGTIQHQDQAPPALEVLREARALVASGEPLTPPVLVSGPPFSGMINITIGPVTVTAPEGVEVETTERELVPALL